MRRNFRKAVKWTVLIVLFIPYSLCVLGGMLAEEMEPFIAHLHVWANPGKYVNLKNRWWEK